MKKRRATTTLAVATASLLSAGEAHADGDRLEGDLGLSLEVGGGLADRPAAIAQARALYLATAGVYASFIPHAARERPIVVDAGVELRPLFIPRFLKNLEGDRTTWEVALDSLALSIGVHAPWRGRAGLSLSTGLELPLQASFRGFYLAARGGMVLPADALEGARGSIGVFFFTLGYRGVVAAHLVDAGDTQMR